MGLVGIHNLGGWLAGAKETFGIHCGCGGCVCDGEGRWPLLAGGGFPSVAPPQGPPTAKGYKRGWAWGGGATGLHVRHTHTQGYSPAVYRGIHEWS